MTKWGLLNQIFGEWRWDEEFFGLLGVYETLFWVGGVWWGNILGECGLMVVSGALFWVGGSAWENILGGCKWMGLSGGDFAIKVFNTCFCFTIRIECHK